MCIIFSILHLSMDTEIVSLALAIANKAAVDMAVQIIPPDSDFISFMYISRSGIAGSHGNFYFFKEPPVLFPMCLHQLTFPPAVHRSSFSTSLPALSSCFVFLAFFSFPFGCTGLHCWVWAFSSCSERGYSSLRYVGVSSWWPLLLQGMGSRARGLQWLWLMGLVPPRHVESSQTRNRARVSSIGKWVLSHRTTREVWLLIFDVSHSNRFQVVSHGGFARHFPGG